MNSHYTAWVTQLSQRDTVYVYLFIAVVVGYWWWNLIGPRQLLQRVYLGSLVLIVWTTLVATLLKLIYPGSL